MGLGVFGKGVGLHDVSWTSYAHTHWLMHCHHLVWNTHTLWSMRTCEAPLPISHAPRSLPHRNVALFSRVTWPLVASSGAPILYSSLWHKALNAVGIHWNSHNINTTDRYSGWYWSIVKCLLVAFHWPVLWQSTPSCAKHLKIIAHLEQSPMPMAQTPRRKHAATLQRWLRTTTAS